MSSLPWKSLTPGCPRPLSLRLQTRGLDLQGPSRSKLSTLAVAQAMSKNTHQGTNRYGQCIVDLATPASSQETGPEQMPGLHWMNEFTFSAPGFYNPSLLCGRRASAFQGRWMKPVFHHHLLHPDFLGWVPRCSWKPVSNNSLETCWIQHFYVTIWFLFWNCAKWKPI